jgi:hypothetical protein
MFSRNPEELSSCRSSLDVSEAVSARQSGHSNPFAAHPGVNSMADLLPTCDIVCLIRYVTLQEGSIPGHATISADHHSPTNKRMSWVTVVGGGTIRPSDRKEVRGLYVALVRKKHTRTRVIPVQSEVRRYRSVQIWLPPPTSRALPTMTRQ